VESAALGAKTAGWGAGTTDQNAETTAAAAQHSHSGLQDEVVSPTVE